MSFRTNYEVRAFIERMRAALGYEPLYPWSHKPGRPRSDRERFAPAFGALGELPARPRPPEAR